MRWALIAISAVTAVFAQDLTGDWAGMLGATPRLGTRIVVNISTGRHAELRGVMWKLEARGSVDAKALNRLAAEFVSISRRNSTLIFTVNSPGGPMSFVGTVSADGNSIDGWFGRQPLQLERNGKVHSSTTGKGPAETAARADPAGRERNAAAAPAAVPVIDPDVFLARARGKITASLERLKSYTCLETIDRTYYGASEEKPIGNATAPRPPISCGRPELDEIGSAVARDRLRLEVAIAEGGKEIHAWPGASRFDMRSVDQVVPIGPMSSGSFGNYLVDVFQNPGTRFELTGIYTDGPVSYIKYSFRVPLEASHYHVKAGEGWVVAAYGGWFQFNAATGELTRLVIETDVLPPAADVCRAKATIDYHYVPIHGEPFLLPSKSELETMQTNATATNSLTTFSTCHEYTAESTIHFDDEVRGVNGSAAGPRTTGAVPPGLVLTLALLAPIDTPSAAMGDPVSARVVRAAGAGDSKALRTLEGATAHGRIVQLQHTFNPGTFRVWIRFEALEIGGRISRLSARPDPEAKAEKSRDRDEETTHFPAAMDQAAGWVFPAPNGECVIPEGFESKWITSAPPSGAAQ